MSVISNGSHYSSYSFSYRHASPSGSPRDKSGTVTNLSTLVAQKRAWPYGTSVMPSRCPIRQTSQRLSAAAAGVVGDVEVVVPVAAAGNAAQAGELSPLCFDLRHSSNRSRILSLFSLRRLPLLS